MDVVLHRYHRGAYCQFGIQHRSCYNFALKLNALIAMNNAKDIPKDRFFAMTLLDEQSDMFDRNT